MLMDALPDAQQSGEVLVWLYVWSAVQMILLHMVQLMSLPLLHLLLH